MYPKKILKIGKKVQQKADLSDITCDFTESLAEYLYLAEPGAHRAPGFLVIKQNQGSVTALHCINTGYMP